MEQSLLESATPGKIVEVSSYNIGRSYYDFNKKQHTFNIDESKLNSKDTYVSIFNLTRSNYGEILEGTNNNLYNALKSHPRIKIIWESEMAVNRRQWHGTFPRNKLVVWEVVPEGTPDESARE